MSAGTCRRGPEAPREDDHRVDPTPPQRVDATGLTFPLEGPSPTELQAVRAFPALDFDRPVYIGHAGDGSHRLFVLEQAGRVLAFENRNDVREANVVLDIRDRVRTSHNEEGLLGLAFDPAFADNGAFYLYYSTSRPRRVVLSRWRMSKDDPNLADPDSERVLLEVEQPYGNHNGGWIEFGPDRKLYVGLGDGGAGGDPHGAGQDLSTLLAKILRLEIDERGALRIPADNPFVGKANARPEIWAYGLRNPWRCGFDRQTGSLWCGDVGQDAFEEVDIVVKGGNYGWRHFEGNHAFDPPRGGGAKDAIAPVFEYDRRQGQSITGGYVYRGLHLPALRGAYVYGDYVSGNVWALVRNRDGVVSNELVAQVPAVASFGEDEAGELFAVGHRGRIYRFEPADEAGARPAFPTLLSQTGLFEDTAALHPAPGLLPYDVNVELWSDGARKRRWLVLPEGGHIGFARDGAWSFPVGTVVVKHFELETAPGVFTRLETRAMVHEQDGWAGYTYRWNEAQTDAELLDGSRSGTYEVTASDGSKRAHTHVFPSRPDCLRCHTPSYGEILGVRTRQLAGRTTDAGTPLLADWSARGLFDAALPELATLPMHPALADDAAAPADRARAYLDVNCAICHHPGGPAPGSMDLRVQTSLPTAALVDVAPEAAVGLPSERRIAPGAPSQSAVLERMRRRDRHAMPPLATVRPDDTAIAVLSAWIAALPPGR